MCQAMGKAMRCGHGQLVSLAQGCVLLLGRNLLQHAQQPPATSPHNWPQQLCRLAGLGPKLSATLKPPCFSALYPNLSQQSMHAVTSLLNHLPDCACLMPASVARAASGLQMLEALSFLGLLSLPLVAVCAHEAASSLCSTCACKQMMKESPKVSCQRQSTPSQKSPAGKIYTC